MYRELKIKGYRRYFEIFMKNSEEVVLKLDGFF